MLFHLAKIPLYQLESIKKKRIAIVAGNNEINRIENLLKQTNIKLNVVGYIFPENENVPDKYIGRLNQIKEIVEINKIDELIFSGEDLSSQEIIKNMLQLAGAKVSYKIAPPESLSIIGSNSINTAGELYTVYVNSINRASNLRNKRLFDFIFAFGILMLSPILLWFQKRKSGFFQNMISVLFGYKTFVSYYFTSEISISNLPAIKKGILTPIDNFKNPNYNEQSIEKLNLIYAKDYKIWNDLIIVLKNMSSLGR